MKLITTTTNNLEGWSIKEYLQPISSNIVVGANVISDFSASFTDFFGGRSGSYEKKLQHIYDQSILNLQNKAKNLGASAIVGLKIDIDEVSGKGTQMFMITAYGTPVRALRTNHEKEDASTKLESTTDGSYVANKVKAKRIIEISEKTHRLENEHFNFIIENPFPEFCHSLLADLKRTSDSYLQGAELDAVAQKSAAYFSGLDDSISIDALYGQFHNPDNGGKYLALIRNVIIKSRLIDLVALKKILSIAGFDGRKAVLPILMTEKQFYTLDDKRDLEDLKSVISKSFTPLGEIASKKGFLSSEKEVWNCICGRSNKLVETHCSSCKNDIYGFKEDEIKPAQVTSLIEDRLSFIN